MLLYSKIEIKMYFETSSQEVCWKRTSYTREIIFPLQK